MSVDGTVGWLDAVMTCCYVVEWVTSLLVWQSSDVVIQRKHGSDEGCKQHVHLTLIMQQCSGHIVYLTDFASVGHSVYALGAKVTSDYTVLYLICKWCPLACSVSGLKLYHGQRIYWISSNSGLNCNEGGRPLLETGNKHSWRSTSKTIPTIKHCTAEDCKALQQADVPFFSSVMLKVELYRRRQHFKWIHFLGFNLLCINSAAMLQCFVHKCQPF